MSKMTIAAMIGAVVLAVILIIALNQLGYLAVVPSNGPTMHFIIYEADPPNQFAGMNGSWYFYQNHSFGIPFPVITVPKGTTVVIQIINNASSEPHGFTIDYYFNAGTTVRPHESYTLTFVATKVGVFRVYCNVFCSIHPFMQNGELNVTS
jgi:heme/copper-type cytochrome/quinol oxidase subunit 2